MEWKKINKNASPFDFNNKPSLKRLRNNGFSEMILQNEDATRSIEFFGKPLPKGKGTSGFVYDVADKSPSEMWNFISNGQSLNAQSVQVLKRSTGNVVYYPKSTTRGLLTIVNQKPNPKYSRGN